MKRPFKEKQSGSWENVGEWYDKIVGSDGHYYHQHLILPKLLSWIDTSQEKCRLLDLGCGQGILERHLKKNWEYVGVDASKALIQSAKQRGLHPSRTFLVGDLTQELSFPGAPFDYAVFLLSLQNIAHPEKALALASKHLAARGRLFIVLNHPYFRIPRQSAWGIDTAKKLQYRRVDAYLTPRQIPISMHPGKSGSDKTTYSYHFSLEQLSSWLFAHHLLIEKIEEWASPKESTGSKAKMENRARKEFPLFMALSCKKS